MHVREARVSLCVLISVCVCVCVCVRALTYIPVAVPASTTGWCMRIRPAASGCLAWFSSEPKYLVSRLYDCETITQFLIPLPFPPPILPYWYLPCNRRLHFTHPPQPVRPNPSAHRVRLDDQHVVDSPRPGLLATALSLRPPAVWGQGLGDWG